MLTFHFADASDSCLLAGMNRQLIVDEGHRNPMTEEQLATRMKGWLEGAYKGILFRNDGKDAGYALYREETDRIYLRQFFVARELRRRGIGRAAINHLREAVWPRDRRIVLDVLTGNSSGTAFWRSVGFKDYCLTLEILPGTPPVGS